MVFLDANILFSAANPRWLTRQLLDALEDFSAKLMSSAYMHGTRPNVMCAAISQNIWKNWVN
jgi:hypothetical protein